MRGLGGLGTKENLSRAAVVVSEADHSHVHLG